MLNRIEQDLKESLKQREAGKIRLNVLRMVKAAIKNAEIEKGRSLTDDEIIGVIQKEIKARKEVLPSYEKAGRTEEVAKIQEEIKILESYLPAQLSETELEEIIKVTMGEVGASKPSDMGKLMPAVLAKVKGRADGKVVAELAKKLLAN
ncbi:GatB/YqeY domain-containing protein [Carboxydothermus hydrogenoformans]|uniref:GatB/Yqey family protein n=1 Tax=Carboxydothermus hydrogenoformans (strain ATCC BAA-161 / DSM 6008 / Z-2901) TaxID=246194 RepID=Q3AF01_CARHZ|nr:GatB/YqeY domain-containing protein [Carboxydothermus hydrogenoformans]ABB15438.1 GatB/Yqey family protein [Carboxydothermus hydrogenoformans Z-2901]